MPIFIEFCYTYTYMKPLQLQKPHLIVVVGLPGSGKTYFAEQFSDAFSLPYVNYSDLLRKLPDADLAASVADYVLSLVLRTKHTLVIEGRGATFAERQTIMTNAQASGYIPLFVWVQTEPQTCQKRALANGVSTEELIEAARRFDTLHPSEPYAVISGKHMFNSQARSVLNKLGKDQPIPTPKPMQTIRHQHYTPTKRAGRIVIN